MTSCSSTSWPTWSHRAGFCHADLCLIAQDLCRDPAKPQQNVPHPRPARNRGLANLCHCSSGSFDFLETEATAGIEPAMKVLQTCARRPTHPLLSPVEHETAPSVMHSPP